MDSFIALYIFILAAIIGYVIMSKASAKLQPSLIAGASFINGIVLIASIIVMGQAETSTEIIISFVAVMLAAATTVGSYSLSSRMFAQYKINNESEDEE